MIEADADRDAAGATGIPAADDLPAAEDDGPSVPPDVVEAELDDGAGVGVGADVGPDTDTGTEPGLDAGRLGVVLRGTTATRRCAWALRCTGELV